MDFFAHTKKGVLKTPNINVLYGESGVGKTTFVSKVPGVYFLDIENGSARVNTDRIGSEVVKNFDDLKSFIEYFFSKNQYTALAIDSATTLEAYINAAVCKENGDVKSINDIAFKGKDYSLLKLREVLGLIRSLQKKSQIDVWIIAHPSVKKYTDPMLMTSYDRYNINMEDGLAKELIREADNVYFARGDISTTAAGKGNKAKGIALGTTTLHTKFNAAFIAKSRESLPESIPFDFDEYQKALAEYSPKPADALTEDIKALLVKVQVADPELHGIAKEKLTAANGDTVKMQRIKEKLLDATRAL